MGKYLKNIVSYSDLKDKYKTLLKQNHPDNGGNVEIMQEINCEYEALFSIWKNKAEKENTLTEDEKAETAKSTKRYFYSAYGWEGSRYDSNLSLKEIAKIVRNYVKEKYPTCKFSIRTKYGSMCQSLLIDLLEFPTPMYKTAEELREIYYTKYSYTDKDGQPQECEVLSDEIQNLWRRLHHNNIFTAESWSQEELLNCYTRVVFEEGKTNYGVETEYFKSVIDDVNSFVASYNYDDSDSQTDYFDVNFYDGKVDYYDCKYVPKVARIKENKNEVSTNNTTQEAAQLETNEERYTITESEHTKTGERIYLVKWLDTLSRDAYINLNNQIKKIGGYYSKFTHSFVFKENPVELLKGVIF